MTESVLQWYEQKIRQTHGWFFASVFFSTHPSYCYFCDHRSKKWVRCYLPRPPFFICRYYRAPEVILGMDYAEKVDVWALGCIFAEMVLARTLFPGQNHVHQWLTITETLGTPNESFVSRLEPNVRRYVMGMKYFRPQSFESLFPDRQFPPSNSVSPPLLWKVVFPGFSPTVLYTNCFAGYDAFIKRVSVGFTFWSVIECSHHLDRPLLGTHVFALCHAEVECPVAA